MKNFMSRLILGCLYVLAGIVAAPLIHAKEAPPSPDALLASLDADVRKSMEESHIVGLSAAIVKDGEVRWAQGFGRANLARGLDVTADTVFVIASSSKVVVAAALMKAVEDGRLCLDQDVNEVLPFRVRNPQFAQIPITPRSLATHRSGIIDNEAIYSSAISYNFGGDHPTPLGVFLKDYLVAGGKHYDAGKNFASAKRGIHFEYSNIGAGLLGFTIESAVKQSFEQYTKDNIFEPLGMTSTGWHMRDVDMSRHAVPYMYKDGLYHAYQHFGLATYPDGGLRTTSKDFGRFLAMVMQEGSLDGRAVLAPKLVRLMLSRQAPDEVAAAEKELPRLQGLIWRQSTSKDGRFTYWWHTGGDPGTTSLIAFDLTKRIGVVLLMNSETTEAINETMTQLRTRMFETAMRMPARQYLDPTLAKSAL